MIGTYGGRNDALEFPQNNDPVASMAAPWLSVAMTTYNAHDYLEAALDGIVAQRDDGVEVIIVDDGSTDDTPEIVDRYRPRLDLKFVAREHSGNWIESMNIGLRAGRGRFACFLHHDDVWFEGRLARAKTALAHRPGTTLLLNPSWFIDRAGARLNIWNCPLREGGDPSPEFVVGRLLVQNFIAVPAPIFLRDAALRLGGLDEVNWHSADWDLWLKLAASGPTTYISRPTTGYRVHPVAATWNGTGHVEAYRWQMDAVLEKHIAYWETRSPICPGVRSVARFSVEANLKLAAFAHGHRPSLAGLAARFLNLGPAGWHRYLRDSRIVERVSARVRAGMLGWNSPGRRVLPDSIGIISSPAERNRPIDCPIPETMTCVNDEASR